MIGVACVQPRAVKLSGMRHAFLVLVLLLAGLPATVHAQFPLEDFAYTACGAGESLFRSGLEPPEAVPGVRPSGGVDVTAGALNPSVFVPETGLLRAYRLYLPSSYGSHRAWPLVVALHGAAGSAAAAPNAADAVRSLWEGAAEAGRFLVLVPIASGSQGGWVPAADTPTLACAIAAVERRFNIDRARRHLWGFSAGAHYGHAVALGNASRFAAYGANAGALLALSCGPPGSGASCDVLLPQAARRIPALLRVGDLDPLAPHAQADLTRFQAAGWLPGSEVELVLFGGGHQAGLADVTAAWAWFEDRALSP
jgi:poly(3-hydroxybutyrate) depolymerase